MVAENGLRSLVRQSLKQSIGKMNVIFLLFLFLIFQVSPSQLESEIQMNTKESTLYYNKGLWNDFKWNTGLWNSNKYRNIYISNNTQCILVFPTHYI